MHVQVVRLTSSHSGVLPAAIVCASLALSAASSQVIPASTPEGTPSVRVRIPMFDIVTACDVGLVQDATTGNPLLLLTPGDDEYDQVEQNISEPEPLVPPQFGGELACSAVLTIAQMPSLQQVTFTQQQGSTTPDQLTSMMTMIETGCAAIADRMRMTLKEHLAEALAQSQGV